MVLIIIPLFVLMFLLWFLHFVECSLCAYKKLLSAQSQTSRRSCLLKWDRDTCGGLFLESQMGEQRSWGVSEAVIGPCMV